MNLTTTPSSSTPAPARNNAPAAPRENTPASAREGNRNHPARERFERALQSREQEPSPDEEGAELPREPDPPASWAATLPPAPLRSAPGPLPMGGAAPLIEKSGTSAKIETALSANPGQAVTPLNASEPAALWEVSVSEPLGTPVQVRAERIATADAQRAWGLTIGAPAANLDMLVRHTPRLNERLRKHGIELEHVRVEQTDNDDER